MADITKANGELNINPKIKQNEVLWKEIQDLISINKKEKNSIIKNTSYYVLLDQLTEDGLRYNLVGRGRWDIVNTIEDEFLYSEMVIKKDREVNGQEGMVDVYYSSENNKATRKEYSELIGKIYETVGVEAFLVFTGTDTNPATEETTSGTFFFNIKKKDGAYTFNYAGKK